MILERVKELADKYNLTIAALEREAGLANGTVGKWQTVNPRIDNLQAVASVLKVSVNDLIGETGGELNEHTN